MKRNCVLVASILSCVSLYANEQPAEEVVIPAYEHRINFDLLRLGYEHIKPDAFYVGVECWYLFGFNSHGFRPVLGEAEARLGYNFSLNPSNTITPYIAGGYFRSFGSGKKQEIVYPSLGFRYEHIFGTTFNLGLNLEGMLGSSLDNKQTSWGDPIWGVDAGLPFTWRFTKKRNWDVRLEPFFTGWFGKNTEGLFGGLRGAIGYRF